MRLSAQEILKITEQVRRVIPQQHLVQIIIYGSRIDEASRGGDVDIYVEVDGINHKALYENRLTLRPAIEEAVDLPVDLVMQSMQEPLKAISVVAKKQGVVIWPSPAS